MSDKNEKLYFVNDDLNSLELEDWLLQQSLFVGRYNKLQKEKATLLEQLESIENELAAIFNFPFEGKLNLPWEPNPFLKNHQEDKL
ncbi:hypothetical protein [Providencia rustigianii]|uniref:hypothetical protein n=1 Tax=Providencia rustigianii TaxID=158850 RepID=UPI0022402D35|nr:hypothetical protein [Providencia rustigianii]